jgi:hypothetical protein
MGLMWMAVGSGEDGSAVDQLLDDWFCGFWLCY